MRYSIIAENRADSIAKNALFSCNFVFSCKFLHHGTDKKLRSSLPLGFIIPRCIILDDHGVFPAVQNRLSRLNDISDHDIFPLF